MPLRSPGGWACPRGLSGDAGERLTRDQVRFEDVIANAEYHRQIAEKERALAEQQETQQIRDEADRLRRRWRNSARP